MCFIAVSFILCLSWLVIFDVASNISVVNDSDRFGTEAARFIIFFTIQPCSSTSVVFARYGHRGYYFCFFQNYVFVLQGISKTTFNNNHSNKTFSKIFAFNRPNYCSKIIKYLKKYSVSQTREWIRQDPFRDQEVAGTARYAENSLIFVCLRPPCLQSIKITIWVSGQTRGWLP